MGKQMAVPILVNAQTLSAIIGIPAWSIRKYARDGKLPAYKFDRKQYLFKVDEVIKVIESHKV